MCFGINFAAGCRDGKMFVFLFSDGDGSGEMSL